MLTSSSCFFLSFPNKLFFPCDAFPTLACICKCDVDQRAYHRRVNMRSTLLSSIRLSRALSWTLPFATALIDSCRSSSFHSQEESVCCQAAPVLRLLPSSFLAAPSSHLHSRLWLSEPLAPWSPRGTVGLMTCRHRCRSSPSARSWLSKKEHNGSQVRSIVNRGWLPGGLSCGPCRENARKQCQLILTRSRQQGHQGTLQLRKKVEGGRDR
mmetsp:Transcript_12806/g.44956  ORF Transcript_12806/g.44956 Transcript_12806/m.44956 type:complete len:211 (+) Transcript_12806:873-1505(+)